MGPIPTIASKESIMFSAAQIEILDAFDLPAKWFGCSDIGYLNAGSLARKINKRNKVSKHVIQKLSKAERIEFYALQVAEKQPIEFQPDDDLLLQRQMSFVEKYCNITGDEID
jgi:hypothetical protein